MKAGAILYYGPDEWIAVRPNCEHEWIWFGRRGECRHCQLAALIPDLSRPEVAVDWAWDRAEPA